MNATLTAPIRLVAALVIALLATVVTALPADATNPLSAPEQQFLNQVNGHRANAGLPPVRIVNDLTDAARAQSQRMSDQNRLYHTENLGGVISGWLRLGENVGYGGSVEAIDNALINSPGHRANILNSSYTQVGIGVVTAASGRIWVTQIFRQPDSTKVNEPSPGTSSPTTQSAPSNSEPPLEPAAGVDTSVCPVDRVTWFAFSDIDPRAAHRAAADCSAWWGLVQGKAPKTFAPASGLTREQLATIIARALAEANELPTTARDFFVDDAGSVHENAINALAAAGVLSDDTRYFNPRGHASRAQVAAMLVRATEYALGRELPSGNVFSDTLNSPLVEEISKAAAVGIVNGYSSSIFNPSGTLRRDHAASVTTRTLKVFIDNGELTVPSS